MLQDVLSGSGVPTSINVMPAVSSSIQVDIVLFPGQFVYAAIANNSLSSFLCVT
jgi:hypothetical protein